MASTDTNDIYWRAYFKAIKLQAGGGATEPGMGKEYFYIASNANRSIAASRFIPMATTNEYLYQEADNLMDPNAPLYVPGAGNTSYVQALYTYLRHVKRPRDTLTPEEEKAEKALTQKLKDAQATYRSERKSAMADWKEEKDFENLSFGAWAFKNARTFYAAWEALNTADGALQDFLASVYGADAQKYRSDMKKISGVANDILAPVPGLSMTCSNIPVLDVAEGIEKAKKGDRGPPVGEPVGYERPAYSLDPQYRDTMDRWAVEYDSTPSTGNAKVTWEQGSKTSWKEFGFENIEAGGGVTLFGFLRIGGHGGSHTEYENVKIDEKNSTVDIELKWKKLQFFNVYPGTWNIPQIRETYPEVVDLDEAQKLLIRPTQFLCASGLSITCKLGGQAKEEADRLYKKQVEAGGSAGVRWGLFGFDAGGGYKKEDGTQTSTSSYDTQKGELTISPTPTFGNCTLLGVRGQAVSI
ncbi:hypothetical protein B0T21DRAFT_411219 [Apiosordaria backusii]|uniref:Uncharacterized protein n=1 Tax=Apiosordaria backusii TaxID=314023 RepID=A0AA40BKT3_9PEZI|nr:hypothetical protein B0T21DRAFT_411219 [Apiosordaria backusii]